MCNPDLHPTGLIKMITFKTSGFAPAGLCGLFSEARPPVEVSHGDEASAGELHTSVILPNRIICVT